MAESIAQGCVALISVKEKVGESTDPHHLSALVHSNVDHNQSTTFIWKRLVMQGGWFLP